MSTFNKEKLSELLSMAIGKPTRSLNQYARNCGVDSAYISRFINMQKINPPSPGVLKRLSKHAHNGVTYDDLMEAAGHIESEPNTTKSTEKQEIVSPQNDRLDEYENIKKINGIAADDGNNEVNDDLLRDVNNYIGFRLKQIEEEKKKK